MPNPFTRAGQTKQSTEPREHVTPVPDSFAPEFLPYRGTQTHGVAPSQDSHNIPDHRDDARPVPVIPLPEKPEPVPVVVISDTGRRIRQWRGHSTYATPSVAQIVGAHDKRTKVTIRNLSTDKTAYLGPDVTVSVVNGFPVLPGGAFEIGAESAVYGVCDGASENVPLSVLVEYQVDA